MAGTGDELEPTEEQEDLPTENSSEDQEKSKKLEAELEEARKQYEEHIKTKLDECQFDMIDGLDGRRYSFIFSDKLFIFRLPSFMESTQIKSILSQITFVPGSGGKFSSTAEIEGSGDLDLICSSKLMTHITVLVDKKPDDFDLEKLDEQDQFELGYLIFIAEREFLDRKKKLSSDDQ